MGPKYLIGLTTNVEDGTGDTRQTTSYLSLHKLLVGQPRASTAVSLPDDNTTTLSAGWLVWGLSDFRMDWRQFCLSAF